MKCSLRCTNRDLRCRHCVAQFVNVVVGVSQQRVGEAGLQEVHGKEGGVVDDEVKQDVDRFAVADVLLVGLLSQPQEARRGQCQELLEPVLEIVAAAEAEQDAKDLVDGDGQAVDIVGMGVQLNLISKNLRFDIAGFDLFYLELR